LIKSQKSQKERLDKELHSESKKRVTLIEPAEAPSRPDVKKHIQESALAAIGALMLGVFGVTFRELRLKKISTADEVSDQLGLRVVGTIPALPQSRLNGRGRYKPGDETLWNRVLIESMDSIRAILLCDDQIKAHRVLLITSARSREGKTMLSAHLATSLARSGLRILLIDADLRSPALHRVFDLPGAPGLSEALSGVDDVVGMTQPTVVPNLSLLPAGQCTREVISLLTQSRLGEIIDGLRNSFDLIIVDSSPVLPVADALLIGKHVDAAMLAIRPHISQTPAVQLAFDRLQDLRIRVLGCIVTGVRKSADSYDYQYMKQIKS
jgi:succinoglycan biosynthesis transport protein ExoP